jgi:hypothetical protein
MSTPYPKSIDDIGKESTNIRERDRDPLDDGVIDRVIDRAVDTTIPVAVVTETPDYIKILGGILGGIILGVIIYFNFKNIKNKILSNSVYYKI